MLPEGLRVRRRFRWRTIPWERIRAIESTSVNWGRNQEVVDLKISPKGSERLGTFNCAFARNMRDRLRYELVQRANRDLQAANQ